METDDWALLNQLVHQDHVILTPSQAHDDFYVIDYAVKYNGFIVTNDMFRDHVSNKRIFHGKRLTSNWVRSHCIDFTFVGTEFMPNPRTMERAESDDVQEDGMVVDHKGTKRSKTIDLSEVTYYKVPRELLPMLHGEGGETMGKFQEYTGTYIVLPSHAASAAPSTSNVLTLSIYGPEPSRLQAVGHLDAFLVQMQQQYAYQHQQQYMASQVHQAGMYPHQHQPSTGTQDDQMMEIDPY
ncbi:uncharacterized protein PITG_16378 [Phytophthora infestans T30-4]|uniref:Uncharacterized protein n=1 Tax=Phytophthora infestans (strain T30-4) TaxID=403677 RepID=D0NU51_PHYIT|nr:uncharacterized protein PITG_16378 [Phytophthora infestans T30-4]EEY65175.1 conserved hypothetical protein [Phytophthora infestans T30-4]|eukprot:XP_002897432.1 conserved hypothetical protein [Phytophthora infestans T30-4]